MAESAFSIKTFVPISFTEMGRLAKKAEDLGWDRVYTSESLTDTLAVNMWMASQTERIVIVSNVALIYYRHPLIAAQAATTISDVSGGRFILGLGLGHQPRNHILGVGFGKPLGDVRDYVGKVRAIMSGEDVYPDLPLQTYEGRALEIRRPAQRVPIHIAAVGPKMIELGGEIADGISLNWVPLSRIGEARQRIERGAARAGRDPAKIEVNLGVHVLLCDDIDRARDVARSVFTYWLGMPSYNASVAQAGFEAEAAAIRAAFLEGDPDGMRAAMTDALLDEFAVLGPAGRCRDRIAAVRDAGIDVPILGIDPVEPGEGYAEAIERTLRQLSPR